MNEAIEEGAYALKKTFKAYYNIYIHLLLS